MTRKDYEAFAEGFRTARPFECGMTGCPSGRESAIAVWIHAARMAADIFQRDNPRFDRARFLKACNLPE